MLRHFTSIHENALTCLLDRGYALSQVEENLQMPGSKFHPDFASDIKTLLQQVEGKLPVQETRTKKYIERVYHYSEAEMPRGIGTLGVFDKKDLLQIHASEPYTTLNRGQLLWHAWVPSMPITNYLSIVIKEQAHSSFLITAFPGLPTPAIPNHTMKEQAKQEAMAYWQEKVFLAVKK